MSETDRDIPLHHEIARTIRNPEAYLERTDSRVQPKEIALYVYVLSDQIDQRDRKRPMLDDFRHHDTEYGSISDRLREHIPYDEPYVFDRAEAYIQRSLKDSDNVVSYIHEDRENEFELLGSSP